MIYNSHLFSINTSFLLLKKSFSFSSRHEFQNFNQTNATDQPWTSQISVSHRSWCIYTCDQSILDRTTLHRRLCDDNDSALLDGLAASRSHGHKTPRRPSSGNGPDLTQPGRPMVVGIFLATSLVQKTIDVPTMR